MKSELERTTPANEKSKITLGEPMLRVGRTILCTAVCALGVIALPAVASATTIDHFTLDSYHASNKKFTPPVTSSVKLGGGLYVATVQGTFSYYGAINYVAPQPPWTILCGTPEAAPQFSSAGGSGKVGFDAEFIFSRPWLPAPCANAKLPVHWTNFQMNVGNGVWAHPVALNVGTPPAPNPSHTYEYAIASKKGHHVAFRLYDINTRDNYGSLHISLRAATSADCTKYAAFGSTSEAECITDLG
jgi:hypothetical protein